MVNLTFKTARFVIFSLLVSVTFTSCISSYSIANAGIDPIVFTKPVYRDSATVTDYLGGKYSHSYDYMYFNPGETNAFGQAYWFRTRSDQDYTYSYGAYGYLGNYNVQATEYLNGKKSYFGGGISGDLCFNIDLPQVDFRIIGIKGSLFYEDGNYLKFKNLVDQTTSAFAAPDRVGFNMSSFSGIDFKLKKSSLGFYFSAGLTSGLSYSTLMFTSSAIVNYQTDRMTFYLQNSSNLANLFYFGSDIAIGLNYRLK